MLQSHSHANKEMEVANCRKVAYVAMGRIFTVRTTVHNGQCTYLNIGLLAAPCEYVLHGLILGVY
jgi:hypothetical protein